jgi:hypothetical protein
MQHFKVETIHHFWRVVCVPISILFCTGFVTLLPSGPWLILPMIVSFLFYLYLNRFTKSFIQLTLSNETLWIVKKKIPFLRGTKNYEINLKKVFELKILTGNYGVYSSYIITATKRDKLRISRNNSWKEDRDDFRIFIDSIEKSLKKRFMPGEIFTNYTTPD